MSSHFQRNGVYYCEAGLNCQGGPLTVEQVWYDKAADAAVCKRCQPKELTQADHARLALELNAGVKIDSPSPPQGEHSTMTSPMKQIPLLDFSAMKEWFSERTTREQELLQEHWSDLVSEFLESTETHLARAVEEEEENTEDILEFVERVDDLLDSTTVMPGDEGWTEAYREYCKDRPLEHLPKFPAEGFRVYAPEVKGFTTQMEGDRVVRETYYYKTQTGGPIYAEKGYFVRYYYSSAKYNYKEEVFEVGRKPLDTWHAQRLGCSSMEITWNKEGVPTHINVKRRHR
jgi:hypothetical protein